MDYIGVAATAMTNGFVFDFKGSIDSRDRALGAYQSRTTVLYQSHTIVDQRNFF
jgi:hypothetical protein